MSIKFRKCFAKFMIPIALFKKFQRLQFFASVEFSNMARCSSKSKDMRDIDSIVCRTRNVTIIDNFKIEIVMFIINFGRNNLIRN